MTKLTKRDYFTAIKTVAIENQDVLFHCDKGSLTNEEIIAFIDHELELLSKKNAAEKKLTPVQQENMNIQEIILNFMEPDRLYTITDLMKSIPECGEMSNQRVTAIVRIMRDDGRVERVEEKRKAYFRLPVKGE